jgi:hypothetical protein
MIRQTPQLRVLPAVGPRQTPLFRQQEPIQAAHRKAVPSVPGKLSAAQREINQKIIINKAVESNNI